MQYKTLLVDSSYLAYQMYFSATTSMLCSPGTQVAYGFLLGILDLQKVHNVDSLIVVWDCGHSAKDALYEDYKKPHSSVLDEDQRVDFREQFCLLNELLQLLGVKCSFALSAEADDVIAHLCQYGQARVLGLHGVDGQFVVRRPILIVSGDHDLYPLLASDISIWKSRKNELYTIDSFRNEFSLEPPQYKEMLALMGCSSDNVPGVRGIGPKYAQKLMVRYGSISGIMSADDSDTTATRVKDQRDALELSVRLVSFEKVDPLIVMHPPNLSKARKRLFALSMSALITNWRRLVQLSKL